jgi:hypothetical protein
MTSQTTTTTISRNAAAALLGISGPRVTQLTQAGDLPTDGTRYEPVAVLRAYISYLKRDDAGRQARTRHQNSQALALESRVQRELRHLLTLTEVRTLAEMIFDSAFSCAQAESSRFYSEVIATNPEMEARRLTGRVYDPMVALARAWRDGVADFLKRIETDSMQRGDRLDWVANELRLSIAKKTAADETALSAKPAKRKR